MWTEDVRRVHHIGGAEGGVAVRLLLSVEGLLKVKANPFSPLPRLRVMSFSPVRLCRRTGCPFLTRIKWLSSAYEQNTARINSPPALHLNNSGTNQRRGGAFPSSSVQNLMQRPPNAIYQIYTLENEMWPLRMWNTNIADLMRCQWYSSMYTAFMLHMGPIILSLSHPIIHSSSYSHIEPLLLSEDLDKNDDQCQFTSPFFIKLNLLRNKTDNIFDLPY